MAAKQEGVELGTPLLVPAGLGFLGSFGAITSFRSTVPDRATLLHVAAYGPAFGTAASLVMLLAGLALSAAGVGDGELQPAAFQDSLLVGVLGLNPADVPFYLFFIDDCGSVRLQYHVQA